MQYENRQPPEGINVTSVNPYTQFLKLVVATLLLLALLAIVLHFAGGTIAKRVPFSYEKQLSAKMDFALGSQSTSPAMVDYLNDLASRLEPGMELSEGVSVTVHYSSDDVFNAFATLGGNLLFYRGLLEELPHENALAMVMAHEMAHVNHRDPIAGLGGGLATAVAISFVTGSSGTAAQAINSTSTIANTQFTRKMEGNADAAALAAVNSLYGHVNGAAALFEIMGEVSGGDSELTPDWIERFTVTHPLTDDRISSISQMATENGWSADGNLTPLPAEFLDWLSGQ